MRSLIALVTMMVSTAVFGNQLRIHLPDQTVVDLNSTDIVTNFAHSSFSTNLPWFEGSQQFSGISVLELLNKYELNDVQAITFKALNDYSSTTSIEDIKEYAPIIATTMNGQPMRIRHKGPYWLIYNLAKYPIIDNPAYHSQMVWQIDEIVIHSAQNGIKK